MINQYLFNILKRPLLSHMQTKLLKFFFWLQEMSERGIEMKFNQMAEKIERIEEMQKITMEAHEAKQIEEKINIRIAKLQNEINEDIKEMKAEVNAGRTIVFQFFILNCGDSDWLILICKMSLLVSK